ncbi:hypothetical protein DYL59_26520 [Pseudomonas kairouanensis]|uniref:Gingipain domain-containing protein n=1 Tax=Pseudomonas kairouanensis TaxID=2293832 RepID=A0A4Z0AFJ0_9PSED|nr:hypothetical protein [Pseudomonas kairouanensis]TFY85147.1 hypothetical protein DYL59_26520 [Pseudomonas kairouanensis]
MANEPSHLLSNAWCGDKVASGDVSATASAWSLSVNVDSEDQFNLDGVVPPAADLEDWQNKEVGWGLVLPDSDDWTDEQKAQAADAPECVKALLVQRGNAPVFRYRSELANTGQLRRYFADKSPADPHLAGDRGIGDYKVPRYLLIIGSPKEIPWSFQYRLQTDAFVGRLDLDKAGLENYINGLLNHWPGNTRHFDTPVVWAVNHGHPDISYLMAKTIAKRVSDTLTGYGFTPAYLTDEQARLQSFYQALKQAQPAFVLTTSHGATFPLDSPAQLAAQLGLLVDVDQSLLNVQMLQQHWNPSGAIWYAHACCSAGADKPSEFRGLVDPQSSLGEMLGKVAEIGPCTASLPRTLLGAKQPLGAFVGHVEPTFDWTLRDPDTGQVLVQQMIVNPLTRALHANPRQPIGMAIDGYYSAVAGYLLEHSNGVKAYNNHKPDAVAKMLKAKLLAMDRLAMVTLGDPTVCLP